MHHLVLPSACTDHIDGNRLDNRRANLRVSTASANAQNRSAHSKKASLYVGVFVTKRKRWRAKIVKDKKQYYLGTFTTEIEAAAAYDVMAVKLFASPRLNLVN